MALPGRAAAARRAPPDHPHGLAHLGPRDSTRRKHPDPHPQPEFLTHRILQPAGELIIRIEPGRVSRSGFERRRIR